MPMESQMHRGLAAGGYLARFNQYQQVQTGFALGVALVTQPFFEGSEVFNNGR
jgi:hypothetical protein